jgi:hypothetical protein
MRRSAEAMDPADKVGTMGTMGSRVMDSRPGWM